MSSDNHNDMNNTIAKLDASNTSFGKADTNSLTNLLTNQESKNLKDLETLSNNLKDIVSLNETTDTELDYMDKLTTDVNKRLLINAKSSSNDSLLSDMSDKNFTTQTASDKYFKLEDMVVAPVNTVADDLIRTDTRTSYKDALLNTNQSNMATSSKHNQVKEMQISFDKLGKEPVMPKYDNKPSSTEKVTVNYTDMKFDDVKLNNTKEYVKPIIINTGSMTTNTNVGTSTYTPTNTTANTNVGTSKSTDYLPQVGANKYPSISKKISEFKGVTLYELIKKHTQTEFPYGGTKYCYQLDYTNLAFTYAQARDTFGDAIVRKYEDSYIKQHMNSLSSEINNLCYYTYAPDELKSFLENNYGKQYTFLPLTVFAVDSANGSRHDMLLIFDNVNKLFYWFDSNNRTDYLQFGRDVPRNAIDILFVNLAESLKLGYEYEPSPAWQIQGMLHQYGSMGELDFLISTAWCFVTMKLLPNFSSPIGYMSVLDNCSEADRFHLMYTSMLEMMEYQYNKYIPHTSRVDLTKEYVKPVIESTLSPIQSVSRTSVENKNTSATTSATTVNTNTNTNTNINTSTNTNTTVNTNPDNAFVQPTARANMDRSFSDVFNQVKKETEMSSLHDDGLRRRNVSNSSKPVEYTNQQATVVTNKPNQSDKGCHIM